MALFRRKRSAGSAPAELVDISDGARAVEKAPARPPTEFGQPTPCPACGHHGYLDGIDIKRRIMFQHCPTCAAKWETSEAELLSTQ